MFYKKMSCLTLKSARKKQRQMKKKYGYKPSIYKVKNPRTGKSKYVLIKPRGLKKVG